MIKEISIGIFDQVINAPQAGSVLANTYVMYGMHLTNHLFRNQS